MLRIVKLDHFFPGGYTYQQPETGFRLDGNSMLATNARALLAHRKANHLARATLEECFDDIEADCCRRYPALCYDETATHNYPTTAGSPVPMRSRVVYGCGGCGGTKA